MRDACGSGKPVNPQGVAKHADHVVGFRSVERRDQFNKAIRLSDEAGP
jgi:hypothetical protein